MIDPAAICLLFAGLLITDGLARPSAIFTKRLRHLRGTIVLMCIGTFALGALTSLTGAWLASALLVLILSGTLSLVSNIKREILGEPLVFSDFALVGAVFQHPQFYVSALKSSQIVLICLVMGGLVSIAIQFSTDMVTARIGGVILMIASGIFLAASINSARWHALAEDPRLDRDVGEFGLIATLIVYWHLWLRQDGLDEGELPLIEGEHGQLIVVVQCESFADPLDLFGDTAEPLPGLTRAREFAWMSGRLMVPGFGAYTMRTEFGALFGLPEKMLGLRQFDPFLTAAQVAQRALPHRLGGSPWKSIFIHPHDMRFYGRDRLMPTAGFNIIVGEDGFTPPAPDEGRYVTDAALTDKLLELAGSSEQSCLIYAVSIENHGPWGAGAKGSSDSKAEYLRLLANGDAMLSRLLSELPKQRRSTILCFFGDHRPSIRGVATPSNDRHTPYVILKFGPAGEPLRSLGPGSDLTPAELHHAILGAVHSG